MVTRKRSVQEVKEQLERQNELKRKARRDKEQRKHNLGTFFALVLFAMAFAFMVHNDREEQNNVKQETIQQGR